MVKPVNWSETELSIDFDTVEIDGNTMSLMIMYDNKIVWQEKKMPKGLLTWRHKIKLPNKVSLIVGNHNNRLNYTDNDGNLIPQSIKIKAIKMDNYPCNKYYQELNTILEKDEDGELILGDVLCANGRMDLQFNEPTAFHWLVKTQDI